jgi:hypothetical protein
MGVGGVTKARREDCTRRIEDDLSGTAEEQERGIERGMKREKTARRRLAERWRVDEI